MNINCKSTVNGMSDTVTQIIHFVGGVKRTYHGILSDSIKQGQMTKIKLSDGRLIFINDANVLCIEIIDESSQV